MSGAGWSGHDHSRPITLTATPVPPSGGTGSGGEPKPKWWARWLYAHFAWFRTWYDDKYGAPTAPPAGPTTTGGTDGDDDEDEADDKPAKKPVEKEFSLLQLVTFVLLLALFLVVGDWVRHNWLSRFLNVPSWYGFWRVIQVIAVLFCAWRASDNWRVKRDLNKRVAETDNADERRKLMRANARKSGSIAALIVAGIFLVGIPIGGSHWRFHSDSFRVMPQKIEVSQVCAGGNLTSCRNDLKKADAIKQTKDEYNTLCYGKSDEEQQQNNCAARWANLGSRIDDVTATLDQLAAGVH